MFPPNGRAAPALVLFDIDGTLIRRAGPHHRQALVDAVRRVTGIETTTENVPVQGMLDREILSVMMRNAGAPAASIRRHMPAIIEQAQRIYVRSCPVLTRKVCPGARGLLYRLSRRTVPTGLVTGNLSKIAWKKMERSGLRHYFRFGAFAELADTRAQLVGLAIDQARRKGWINGAARITLIGDHPNDVNAARANGVRSVAVATGLSPAGELRAHNPDYLVDDLRSVTLEMLLG